MLEIVVSEGPKQGLLDGAGQIDQQVLGVVKSQETLALVQLRNLLSISTKVRFLQLGQASQDQQVTLS